MSPYHSTSRIYMAMASTVGGQRRILKHHGTVIEYMRKAVESGVYRTKEEMAIIMKQRKDGVEDLRIIMNRLRQDVIRGSHIQDYPTEYLILEQHPPILDPPRTPVRILRQLRSPINPIHKLTKKYLKRFEQQTSSTILSSSSSHRNNNSSSDPHTGGPVSSEEYYRRLLGVQQAANTTTTTTSSSSSSATMIPMMGGPTMYQKPVVVQKAYTAALLHYDLMQQKQSKSPQTTTDHSSSSTTGSSSTSSSNSIMKQVEEMLSQQVSYEQSVARERRNNITQRAYQNSNNDDMMNDMNHKDGSSSRKKFVNRNDAGTKQKTSATTTSTTTSSMEIKSEDDPDDALSMPWNTPNLLQEDKSDKTTTTANTNDKVNEGNVNNDIDDDDVDTTNTIHSIFHSDPITIEGMMRWSERLNAVPYTEWTIGASTALDHWIARQILKLSEITWQSTLEGYDTYHLNIGRDIVACREAIFPETIIHATRKQQEMDHEAFEEMKNDAAMDKPVEDDDDDQNLFGIETTTSSSSSSSSESSLLMGEMNETRSIEDLLQRLGGLRSPDAVSEPLPSIPTTTTTGSGGDTATTTTEDDGYGYDINDKTDLDTKINQLVHELQNWRRRNVEVPYDQWEHVDQEKFYSWMKKYVATVSSEAEKRHSRHKKKNQYDMVDYDETRIALLADPPTTAAESNQFWNQLQDESMIEILLDNMIHDGPPPGASILHKSFWELPRNVQVEQLLNLGAVRPLLDEYTKETDRLHFIQRYGDAILTGVPLDHLVPDPAGPIKASDLSRDIVSSLQVGDHERFRLEKIPYKSFMTDSNEVDDGHHHQRQQDAFEKSRLLYKAWNEHKAGRARYEEKLFQTGRLGLRYNDALDINAKKSKRSTTTPNTSKPSFPTRR